MLILHRKRDWLEYGWPRPPPERHSSTRREPSSPGSSPKSPVSEWTRTGMSTGYVRKISSSCSIIISSAVLRKPR